MFFGIKLLQQKWWGHGGHVCSGGTLCALREQSSPDPRAKLPCSISAFAGCSEVSAVTSKSQSLCCRQATKVVQGNKKAEVHLTHSTVSYSPLSMGAGGSRGTFPSQDCSWSCCKQYLDINCNKIPIQLLNTSFTAGHIFLFILSLRSHLQH